MATHPLTGPRAAGGYHGMEKGSIKRYESLDPTKREGGTQAINVATSPTLSVAQTQVSASKRKHNPSWPGTAKIG